MIGYGFIRYNERRASWRRILLLVAIAWNTAVAGLYAAGIGGGAYAGIHLVQRWLP